MGKRRKADAMKQESQQINVFISYAHEDEQWRKDLATHLKSLEKQGLVSVWHDIKIPPGKQWKEEIDDQMNKSELILLLVSADFLASDFCEREMNRALELYGSGRARVVPIIVRPCDWYNAEFANLQVLPEHGEAVSTWPDKDVAFMDIATNLRPTIEELRVPKPQSPRETSSMQNIVNFKKDLSLSIGVDVGATKIDCGLIRLTNNGKPEYHPDNIARIEHDDLKSAEGVLDKINHVIDEVIQKEGIDKGEVDAIGLGLPGMVRRKDGLLHYAPGLQIENFNFCSRLNQMYNVPVHADNDVNCSTFAELAAGCGALYKNFVCVFIRTGIGAGVVVNSCMVRGHNFSAGEVGHMKIDFLPDARACNCGQKGCYEEYASARAIVRLARVKIFDIIERKTDSRLIDLDPRTITPQNIVALVKEGDDEAKDLANEIASYLSIGLANIASLLNPEAIILGGGTIEGFLGIPEFLITMRNKFNDYAMKTFTMTSLEKSSFKAVGYGNPAPIIGAALLPFETAVID